ncbi:MAG: hypothetical protein ABJA79_03670 [Parafilimonas sp.]
MKKTLLILSALLLSLNFTFAQKVAVETSDKPGWHKIGETTANFNGDKDEIIVLGADVFKAMRIKVTDAPVHIETMEVVFDNETRQNVDLKADFKAGEESRVIDLEGGDRKLKKVVYVYRTIPNFPIDKAHIELWGLK